MGPSEVGGFAWLLEILEVKLEHELHEARPGRPLAQPTTGLLFKGFVFNAGIVCVIKLKDMK